MSLVAHEQRYKNKMLLVWCFSKCEMFQEEAFFFFFEDSSFVKFLQLLSEAEFLEMKTVRSMKGLWHSAQHSRHTHTHTPKKKPQLALCLLFSSRN